VINYTPSNEGETGIYNICRHSLDVTVVGAGRLVGSSGSGTILYGVYTGSSGSGTILYGVYTA